MEAAGAAGTAGADGGSGGGGGTVERPTLIVDRTSIATSELGVADSFTVMLSRQPEGYVVVSLTGDDTEGVIDRPTLTFWAANWANPQRVVVAGAAEAGLDGGVTYELILAASGGGYDGVTHTVVVHNDE